MDIKQFAATQPEWINDWIADMLNDIIEAKGLELDDLDPQVSLISKEIDGDVLGCVIVHYQAEVKNTDWEAVFMEMPQAHKLFIAICKVLADIYPDSNTIPNFTLH